MPQIFTNQVITLDGQSLMAQATAANPITWVNSLSNAIVPSDPGDPTSYSGVTGTIDSAAVDGVASRTARIVVAFGNSATSSAQAVKAIAVRAKLASQSDSEAVIFAYCTDAASTITFPPSTSAPQVTRFAFNIIIQPGETVATVSAGDATLADLERFVSCHKAGNPAIGEAQNIQGDKVFSNNITFGGGYCAGDLRCDGTLLISELDLADAGDPDIYCKDGVSLIPYAAQGQSITNTLGDATHKWASVWTNRLYTTTFNLSDTGTQYVEFDGEMFVFKLNPAANADPMMSISYDSGLICSKPICSQRVYNGTTSEIKFNGGDSIEFWSDDGGETAGNIYFFRDDNAALGIQFYDTMFDEEICEFNYEGCRFTGPVNVRSGGIKMPYPGAEGELKLGCPCVLKATNGAQTAIKMGDILARNSSGWDVIRGNSTIAGVALYTCDFSGGNESFVNPQHYSVACRLTVLSSAANGAPFLAMMIER